MERNEEANLFVKNLPQNISTKEIYDLFSQYGNIISVKLKQNDKGECLGYGYVNYDKIDSAQNALENLNNYLLNGRELYVTLFSAKGQRNEEERYPLVLIKQIPPTVYFL
jgi:polyadenylate-binding protein